MKNPASAGSGRCRVIQYFELCGGDLAKQIPKPESFLLYVKPNDKAEVSSRLASIGSVEELDEDTLLLRLTNKVSEPEAQWRQLSELVGPLAMVQPVLSDEQGHTQFPTGDVTVRFLKKPSDKQLKEFATKYRLQLRDRNEFVPEQAAFHVDDPNATYLPNLVEEISADKKIKSAWANTRSRYRRISKD